MKAQMAGWLALAATAWTCAHADIEIGDSHAQVIAELGEPKAEIKTPGFALLTFERGQIELREGLVTKVDMVSQEDADLLRRERLVQDAQAKQLAERQRKELFAEGKATLERKKLDREFPRRPASEQVSYWRAFKQRYPEVDVSAEYESALRLLETEMALEKNSREQEQRIRDLEDRVTAAEQDSFARRQSSVVSYGTLWPAYYTSTPRWCSRSDCNPRPPIACERRPEPTRRRSGITVRIVNGPELCRPAISYNSGAVSVGAWSSAAFH